MVRRPAIGGQPGRRTIVAHQHPGGRRVLPLQLRHGTRRFPLQHVLGHHGTHPHDGYPHALLIQDHGIDVACAPPNKFQHPQLRCALDQLLERTGLPESPSARIHTLMGPRAAASDHGKLRPWEGGSPATLCHPPRVGQGIGHCVKSFTPSTPSSVSQCRNRTP